MWKEFKQFAMKGNVLDMAVGVIIGGAFGKIVTSLVNDIVMPPIGLLLGGVDFTELFVSLDGTHYESLAQAQEQGAATLNYGVFLNTLINFLIVAFSIFLVIKQINRFRRSFEKPVPAAAPTTKNCPECCSEIPIQAKKCKYCTSPVD